MKKNIIVLFAVFFCCNFIMAEKNSANEKENHFELSFDISFAYSCKADFIKGGNHFSAPSGIYDSVGAIFYLDGKYVMPYGDSENVLFKSNNITLGASFEFSPVTAYWGVSVSVKPIAILEFSAGSKIGTGWKFLGFDGFSYYKPEKNEYKQVDAFSTWYYRLYGGATFMFDFEALFPGEWHHVVTLAYYELTYNGGINEPSYGEVFRWQREFGHTDGLRHKFNFLLGYQMPLKVSLVGIVFEFNGYLVNSGLSKEYDDYNAKFTSFSIMPMAQIDLTEKDKLSIALKFASRRSFKENHDDIEVEPSLTQTGSEWFWDYIGVNWKHTF